MGFMFRAVCSSVIAVNAIAAPINFTAWLSGADPIFGVYGFAGLAMIVGAIMLRGL